MNNIESIQVLGAGCPSCKKLYELTSQAAKELGLNTEVAYVDDVQKIISMGVMQSPVLAVNGKPVLIGATFDMARIKQAIAGDNKAEAGGEKSGCSCGDNC